MDDFTEVFLAEFRHDASHVGMALQGFDSPEYLPEQAGTNCGNLLLIVICPQFLKIHDCGGGEMTRTGSAMSERQFQTFLYLGETDLAPFLEIQQPLDHALHEASLLAPAS